MAVLFLDHFDDLSNWTGTSTLVAGRNGTGMRVSGSNASLWAASGGQAQSTWTIGFAYTQASLALTRLFLQVRSSASTNETSYTIDTTGAIVARRGGVGGVVLGTSAAGVVTADTWVFIEVKVLLSETVGLVEIRVNGAVVLNLSGVNTSASSPAEPVMTHLATNGGGASGVAIYDDWYVTEAPFLGDGWESAPVVRRGWWRRL